MAAPQLSALARLFKQNAFEEFEQGLEGPRSSPRQPALRGFTRGSLGSMGSSTLRTRNSDAGLEEEREVLGSPVFRAFMGQFGKVV